MVDEQRLLNPENSPQQGSLRMSEAQEPPKVTPQSLVSEKLLRAALKADKGDDAEMVSWEVKDFTNKGDNYACVVTSGIVRYRQGDDKEREVTYVAKCNPLRNMAAFESFTKIVFMKEAQFYQKIVPLINTELEATGQEPLRLPTWYVNHLVEGKEIIVLKDMRPDGFKMFDRLKGMDVVHVSLVLQELARLHATSTIVQAKMSEPMEVTYDFLQKDYGDYSGAAYERFFETVFASNMETVAKMAEKVGGYDTVVKWLNSNAAQGLDMVLGCLKKSPPFDVICHGDCWNNNILFKYDEAGKPIDVRLIDLQICRKASPATDLNYLMYSSLNGSVRRENLQAFLKTYHDAYAEVLSEFGKPMPFTLEELKKEYHNQNLFGLLMSLMVIPFVVAESNEVIDFEEMTGDMDADVKRMQDKMIEQAETNPLLRPRLLATFDEMLEYGVIS
ncbi:hypothetical protein GWK47_006935 [Chionoecetes opilio]|uniref:CHK kinase-like domain-containing protein n=1 Tax=Chionoecetes opilio TaxID=41210 RepID=A0A8J4Y3G0_CHIOP|nr:hypothetical protein GWK47_006935 [Chionoecetes opilio]